MNYKLTNKMKQLIHQNNINKLNFFKTSLFNDFSKQKNFIINLNTIINLTTSGIKELIPILDNINRLLPYFINELGLPFCDAINETNIIKYYFNTYITNKSETIKNILIAFIQAFNFVSTDKTLDDILIQMLSSYDNTFKTITDNKRAIRTDLEEIYNILNSLSYKKNIENKEEVKKDLLEKINAYENQKSCSISTLQYLKEKINEIENNTKIIDLNNIQNNNIFSNINYLTDNFQSFNSFQNYQNINNNFNLIAKEEVNKLTDIPLQDREFLYKEEQLIDEENEYVEFKNYSYPFAQMKIDEIKRQYCGFLNSHGGRIYLGINDFRIVKGILLDYKLCDMIKNELINYTYDFYPKCRIDKVNVYFIKIKSMQTDKIIPNLYVIKIQVMPGEPHNLYSINNKGGYISTLRLPGQCINLTAEEIHSEILKRNELLKQKYINEYLYNNNNNNNNKNKEEESSSFEDISEDIDDENIEGKEENDGKGEKEEKGEKEPDEKKRKKKVVYVVKITNIDTSLKIKDLNRYFNGYGSSLQKFPALEGKSVGFGEIHFPKKETAKLMIQKFNKLSICGTKQILMKLTKRVTRGN